MTFSKKSQIVSYSILFLASLLVLLPLFWMLVSSFKSQRELYAYPPMFFPTVWRFQNYTRAATTGSVTFFRMFLNTMLIAVPVTVLNILFSGLAAYSFARIRFPGRDFLFMLFITSMMVPASVVLIPQFMFFSKLNLVNTYAPLIMPEMLGKAFSIFLLRQFFMTLPHELEDASYIDGCGRLRIWAVIFMPLSKPIIATLAVFIFQRSYNDFLYPIIYIHTSSKFTIQLGLAAFRSAYSARYELIMAMSVLALLPVLILYIFSHKYIVNGIVMSGIKG